MECSAPSTCCVHSTVPATKDASKNAAPSLVNVSLTAEDLQNISIDIRNVNEDEIARQIDALSTRLKIAQFIAKTLTSRSEELQLVLSTLKQSNSPSETESSNDQPITPPNIIESPFPINRSMDFSPKASVPPILQRRHTTTAASLNLNLKDRPTSGWEERAAAFMLKRRNQQSAMGSLVHTPMPRSNPFEDRRMSRSPEARPTPARSSSDQNPGNDHDQDVLWELERRKQNPRRGALIAAAWITYQDSWDELNAQMAQNDVQPYLTFGTVPWPVLRMSSDPLFKDPTEIKADDVRDFILSPFHSSEKNKESRVRDTYMRWHPDQSPRWLAFVVPSERAKVKEGMEKVNWCLNNLR